MAMNGAGVRDTGRVLGISKKTVTTVKKTGKFVKQVNEEYLSKQNAENPLDAIICNVLSTEMDEIWSFYHNKSQPPLGAVWWAVDHATSTTLAFTFWYMSKNLDKLLALLKLFPIGNVYTDHNFAYEKCIPSQQLVCGKKNTQKIERDHLTLHTRIKRLYHETICFSKSK